MKIINNIKKLQGEFSLKKLLHKKLAGREPGRRMENIHASAVTYQDTEFCPRQYVLMDIHKVKPRGDFISTSLRVTFDHGNDMQARLNNQYLIDEMVGNWKCTSCNSKKSICKKPKGHCGRSGITCNWKYEEVRVTSRLNGISGAIDALVDIGEPKLLLVEVKTMVKDQFINLQAPLAEHRIRTSLYLRLIAESDTDLKDRVNTKRAIILYMVKGYGNKCDDLIAWKEQGLVDASTSPFKEFIIKRDDSLTENYCQKAIPLWVYRQGTDKHIPLGICPNAFNQRAKECPVIKECFSGQYPGKVTWLKNGKPFHKGKPNIKVKQKGD